MKSSFTEAEIKEITRAAKRTFEIIANDLLSCSGEISLSQATVIECVIDADNLITHGKLSRELNERIYAAQTREINRLFKTIFPFKKYS